MVTDGDVADLDIEHHGVLLGVRGTGVAGLPTYREETRTLKPGTTLVLYTDGLTDRRQRADGSGHYTEAEARQMLCAAVRGVAGSSAEVIAQAAEQAVPGDIDDDMAIVVVSTSREDLASWEATFPAEAIRVSEARRHAQLTFERWGLPREQTELACLLVSEVVTNVVLHTATTARRRHRMTLEPAGAPAAASPVGGRGVPAGWDSEEFGDGFPEPPDADLHAAPAARGVGGVGRGVRRRPAAAADPQRGGDRRGRARPVPGGPARHPVGVPADQGRQGGVVRGAGRPRAGRRADGRRAAGVSACTRTPTAAAG